MRWLYLGVVSHFVFPYSTAGQLYKCVPTESTTIALVARRSGLLEPLREFIKVKPVWGTCAGAILLSKAVVGAKRGGQELLGGMSVTIARNGWGSQVRSLSFQRIVMILVLRQSPSKRRSKLLVSKTRRIHIWEYSFVHLYVKSSYPTALTKFLSVLRRRSFYL